MEQDVEILTDPMSTENLKGTDKILSEHFELFYKVKLKLTFK